MRRICFTNPSPATDKHYQSGELDGLAVHPAVGLDVGWWNERLIYSSRMTLGIVLMISMSSGVRHVLILEATSTTS